MAISFLIKPVGDSCNMKCKYCFYHSPANIDNKYMSLDIAESIIKAAFAHTNSNVSFVFQGGEPTLAGLDFYKGFIQLVNKYNVNNANIHYSLQTNGYNLSDDMAKFFADNKFLIGLSLDGNENVQNMCRCDKSKEGSFHKVMDSIQLLQKHSADVNILSVVTAKNAPLIKDTYFFMKSQNLKHLQFIPILCQTDNELTLDNETYSNFLITLFNLWIYDYVRGNYVSIRYFDNLVRILKGGLPEACNMQGKCSVQLVIESNGDVFPCDFYVDEKHKIGNICENSISELVSSNVACNFLNESLVIPLDCNQCEFYNLCRNGCKRERLVTHISDDGINMYCKSMQKFFTYCMPILKNVFLR